MCVKKGEVKDKMKTSRERQVKKRRDLKQRWGWRDRQKGRWGDGWRRQVGSCRGKGVTFS